MRQTPKTYSGKKNTYFSTYPFIKRTSVVAYTCTGHRSISLEYQESVFYLVDAQSARRSCVQVGHKFFRFFSIATETSEYQQIID